MHCTCGVVRRTVLSQVRAGMGSGPKRLTTDPMHQFQSAVPPGPTHGGRRGEAHMRDGEASFWSARVNSLSQAAARCNAHDAWAAETSFNR